MLKRLLVITLVILLNSMQLSFAAEMTGDVLNNGGLGGADIIGSNGGFTGFETDGTNANLGFNGNATINWGDLNVENGQSLIFNNGGNTVLNTVQNGMSTFAGLIQGDSGHIIISNPNGMLLNGGRFETAGALTLTNQKVIGWDLTTIDKIQYENSGLGGIEIKAQSVIDAGGDFTLVTTNGLNGAVGININDSTIKAPMTKMTSDGKIVIELTEINGASKIEATEKVALKDNTYNGSVEVKSNNIEADEIKAKGTISVRGYDNKKSTTDIKLLEVLGGSGKIQISDIKFNKGVSAKTGNNQVINISNMASGGDVKFETGQVNMGGTNNVIEGNLDITATEYRGTKGNINLDNASVSGTTNLVASNDITVNKSNFVGDLKAGAKQITIKDTKSTANIDINNFDTLNIDNLQGSANLQIDNGNFSNINNSSLASIWTRAKGGLSNLSIDNTTVSGAVNLSRVGKVNILNNSNLGSLSVTDLISSLNMENTTINGDVKIVERGNVHEMADVKINSSKIKGDLNLKSTGNFDASDVKIGQNVSIDSGKNINVNNMTAGGNIILGTWQYADSNVQNIIANNIKSENGMIFLNAKNNINVDGLNASKDVWAVAGNELMMKNATGASFAIGTDATGDWKAISKKVTLDNIALNGNTPSISENIWIYADGDVVANNINSNDYIIGVVSKGNFTGSTLNGYEVGAWVDGDVSINKINTDGLYIGDASGNGYDIPTGKANNITLSDANVKNDLTLLAKKDIKISGNSNLGGDLTAIAETIDAKNINAKGNVNLGANTTTWDTEAKNVIADNITANDINITASENATLTNSTATGDVWMFGGNTTTATDLAANNIWLGYNNDYSSTTKTLTISNLTSVNDIYTQSTDSITATGDIKGANIKMVSDNITSTGNLIASNNITLTANSYINSKLNINSAEAGGNLHIQHFENVKANTLKASEMIFEENKTVALGNVNTDNIMFYDLDSTKSMDVTIDNLNSYKADKVLVNDVPASHTQWYNNTLKNLNIKASNSNLDLKNVSASNDINVSTSKNITMQKNSAGRDMYLTADKITLTGDASAGRDLVFGANEIQSAHKIFGERFVGLYTNDDTKQTTANVNEVGSNGTVMLSGMNNFKANKISAPELVIQDSGVVNIVNANVNDLSFGNYGYLSPISTTIDNLNAFSGNKVSINKGGNYFDNSALTDAINNLTIVASNANIDLGTISATGTVNITTAKNISMNNQNSQKGNFNFNSYDLDMNNNKINGSLTANASNNVTVNNLTTSGNMILGAWQYADSNIKNITANNIKSENGMIFLAAKNNVDVNGLDASKDVWAVAGNELNMKNATGASFAIGTDATGDWKAVSKKVTLDNIALNGNTPSISENIWIYADGDIVANNINSGSVYEIGVFSKGNFTGNNIKGKGLGTWVDKDINIDGLNVVAFVPFGNTTEDGLTQNITLNNANVEKDVTIKANNNITIGGVSNTFGSNLTTEANNDIAIKNTTISENLTANAGNNLSLINVKAKNINSSGFKNATFDGLNVENLTISNGGNATVSNSAIEKTLKGENLNSLAVSKSIMTDLIANNVKYILVENSTLKNNMIVNEFGDILFKNSTANELYFTSGNSVTVDGATAKKMVNVGVNNIYHIDSDVPIAYNPNEPSDREARSEATKSANNVAPDTVSSVAIAQSFTPIAFAADNEASGRVSTQEFMQNSVSKNKDGSISIKDAFLAFDDEDNVF